MKALCISKFGRLAQVLSLATLTLVAADAFAHHGWAWAEGDQMTLQGTIESISMAPPHPILKVKSAEGGTWQVDLGNPSQTERSGFKGGTAKAGDAITVLGNRATDKKSLHMKAVRITLDGKHYDMYPERIKD
ncbi:hypothetical protein SAMN05216303_102814 [Rhodoferax sp. OV413]|uniref:DUF6152 family protein n=1 Tax=Rhodoferax sp. OV413 TaxID=1855285 RepID=UPI0008836E04|nr:DUF6152 family protein [Rhodoferax sp. OV413]SDO96737.1 hypothetical protein SAMN05216303_102814 [Rhodoferax sp. OV413]